MKFGIMGTGEVGSTIARGLQRLGHDVVLGSRSPGGEKHGLPVRSHKDAAAFGEIIVNAVHGEDALQLFQGCALTGKILIDIGNYQSAISEPLARTLGETLQQAFPEARVVKTLNYISAHLMIDPASLGGPLTVFVAGNDAEARDTVKSLLTAWGWQDIVDLGDLSAARSMENLASLWVRFNAQANHTNFSLALTRKP
jgi:8-hydroxy-5-deazaflavin:NADPH oxidoreductase